MNYLPPRQQGNARGWAIGAAVLVLGAAAYLLLGGGDDLPASNVAIATAVPSATPSGAATPRISPTATAVPATVGGRYEVIDGDSAWLIAEKLSVPVENRNAWVRELLALNGVDELELQVGQTLVLPPFEPLAGGGAEPLTPAGTPAPEPTDTAEESETGEAAAETPAEDSNADVDGDGGDGRDNRDDDEDDASGGPGFSLDVDSGNVGACATIDDITYCAGSGGTWNCDTSGSSIRCTGPAGQSTTCSGGDSTISCEGPSGESTTCTDTGSSTSCSSTNVDVTSDSPSQNCAVIGSATICFGGNSDDD